MKPTANSAEKTDNARVRSSPVGYGAQSRLSQFAEARFQRLPLWCLPAGFQPILYALDAHGMACDRCLGGDVEVRGRAGWRAAGFEDVQRERSGREY